MKFRSIHFIINPASGQDEPILSFINKTFQDTNINWEVFVTKKADDATKFAQQCLGQSDVIAVYGGDGSISEVAKQLIGKNIPLAIIPGGTANVISKELGIPQDTQKAIELLKNEDWEIAHMDMGLLNDQPFMIRVNFGIMANMVLEANRELKNKVGQLAYGITAVQNIIHPHSIIYNMQIDGKNIQEEGVALTVTNCGNIGFNNYSFLPDISVYDGYLDVIMLKDSDFLSMIKIAGSTLFQNESDVLKHWKCKKIEINLQQSSKVILDDAEIEDKNFVIEVVPNVLKVIVPKVVSL